jgi:hypothetical protein
MNIDAKIFSKYRQFEFNIILNLINEKEHINRSKDQKSYNHLNRCRKKLLIRSVFSHMWKTDPIDKGTHKYKYDHIHTYT